MKKKTLSYLVLLAGLPLLVLWNCLEKADEILLTPTVTLDEVSDITSKTVTAKGNVSSDGGATVTDRGYCLGTNPNPSTLTNRISVGTGTGIFSFPIAGLGSGITYYIRAYAINANGIAYSNQLIFTTVAFATILTTIDITTIASKTATVGGNISCNSCTVIARGMSWGTNPSIYNPKTTNGSGTGTFTSNLTGLLPGTTYYVRAYATNSIEQAFGNEVIFTTTSDVPVLTSTEVTAIMSTTAVSGGNITSDGGSAITTRGVCWATSQNPTTANSKTLDGTGKGTFSSDLTGLAENTAYYLRAYATNKNITCYGNEVCFRTKSSNNAILYNPNLTYGTVADIDGNVYKTITIGTQTWMAENLRTTKYRNGDPIPNVADDASWAALLTGAYCWTKNDAATYKTTCGALYNWFAAADSRNIAPSGWHLPTEADWTTLTNYLGGTSVAGGKLKETGTSHWLSPNTGATNSSGFTALPVDFRLYYGSFYTLGLGSNVGWWSSTYAPDGQFAYYRNISYDGANFYFGLCAWKQTGSSVRCVKD